MNIEHLSPAVEIQHMKLKRKILCLVSYLFHHERINSMQVSNDWQSALSALSTHESSIWCQWNWFFCKIVSVIILFTFDVNVQADLINSMAKKWSRFSTFRRWGSCSLNPKDFLPWIGEPAKNIFPCESDCSMSIAIHYSEQLAVQHSVSKIILMAISWALFTGFISYTHAKQARVILEGPHHSSSPTAPTSTL